MGNTSWIAALSVYLLPLAREGLLAQVWCQSSQCQDCADRGDRSAALDQPDRTGLSHRGRSGRGGLLHGGCLDGRHVSHGQDRREGTVPDLHGRQRPCDQRPDGDGRRQGRPRGRFDPLLGRGVRRPQGVRHEPLVRGDDRNLRRTDQRPAVPFAPILRPAGHRPGGLCRPAILRGADPAPGRVAAIESTAAGARPDPAAGSRGRSCCARPRRKVCR